MASLCGLPPEQVAAVGESSLTELKSRPDYALTDLAPFTRSGRDVTIAASS